MCVCAFFFCFFFLRGGGGGGGGVVIFFMKISVIALDNEPRQNGAFSYIKNFLLNGPIKGSQK